MIKVGKIEVMNFENAIRGMRNPLNSWDKSDSFYGCTLFGRQFKCSECNHKLSCGATDVKAYILGENDLKLATNLCKAGADHRKFMRQIFVSMDILAPLYWWKEFDQYRISVTSNSCSTMHKIHDKAFTLEDFSCEYLEGGGITVFKSLIDEMNYWRDRFNTEKDKRWWYKLIQLLPSSYNQLRTVTLNYETLINIYHARKHHKLDEWQAFCSIIEDSIPYAKELIIDIKG